MGKIILTMQISLNGVVSDVDQWMTLSDEILEDCLEYYQTLDAVIVGGGTYPSLAEYWQGAETDSNSALERAVAKQINEIPKVVISRSKMDLIWRNSRQILVQDNESFAREIENLKKNTRKNMTVESGTKTWQRFIQNELFDDLWLFVHPVVVPQGETLFADVESQFSLDLSHSKIYKNGVVGLYYQKK